MTPQDLPLACQPHAICSEERPRYQGLVQQLRSAIREQQAIDDGYALKLDTGAMSFADLAVWIGLERCCCPFLTFRVDLPAGASEVWLTLSGPPGTREVLQSALLP